MKKIFICLGLMIMLSLSSLSQINIFDSLDYYRVSINYNGIAYNGSTILVFGEGAQVGGKTVSRLLSSSGCASTCVFE